MSLSIETIQSRIKQYEEELTKLVANHTTMTGGLNELKVLLDEAQKAIEACEEVAEEVAPAIEGIVEAIEEA